MSERPATLPTQIGPYKILRVLGAGGMGDVYHAVHEQNQTEVALKVLRPSNTRSEMLFTRFQKEARTTAMLDHENLVRCLEYGEDEGCHYMALELVRGTDLARLIEKKGTLPVSYTLHVVKQVTRALAYAHELGFVHRDIKPSNVMVTKDRVVKVTDLGLARQLENLEEVKVTRDGTTVGTVDYMSPEQSKNSHSADIRSDIYSLGCSWYHMLTGKVPYPGSSVVDRLYKHSHAKVPDVTNIVPGVPEDMGFVLEKMMAKRPEDRFQSPAELLEELDRLDPKKQRTDMAGLALLAQAEMEEELVDDAVDFKANEPRASRGQTNPPSKGAKRRRRERGANGLANGVDLADLSSSSEDFTGASPYAGPAVRLPSRRPESDLSILFYVAAAIASAILIGILLAVATPPAVAPDQAGVAADSSPAVAVESTDEPPSDPEKSIAIPVDVPPSAKARPQGEAVAPPRPDLVPPKPASSKSTARGSADSPSKPIAPEGRRRPPRNNNSNPSAPL